MKLLSFKLKDFFFAPMIFWLGTLFLDFNLVDNLLMFTTMFLISILVFVGLLLFLISYNNFMSKKFFENELVEFLWTFLPGIILIFLGVPSLKILYFAETKTEFDLSLKIYGHQWYWSYNYSDFENLEFDSFMKTPENFKDFRLLETDNHLVLPFNSLMRFFVSSDDVIHSWALPNMNIKVDANPGRMNTFFMKMEFPGIYYGQCSEICGANHSFMPIKVESTSIFNFLNWTKSI